MSELQISTRVRRLFHYLNDFEKGIIRVPAFQRDFEWDNAKKVKLFESIKNGYPIGSILFWRPDFTKLEDFKNFETNIIGSYQLRERAIDYFYILDGYQRLSTLFGCLVNPEKTTLIRDDEMWIKDFNLIYDIENDKIKAVSKINYHFYEIPLYRFVDGNGLFNFQIELFNLNIEKSRANIYIERYSQFGKALSGYDMPSVDMHGGSIEEAVEIFTRLNSEGAKITDEWILSALSFDKSANFRLGTEISDLLDTLSRFNFQNIPQKVIVQSISNSFGKIFFDKTNKQNIEKLKELVEEDNFVDKTRKVLMDIEKAIQFLYENLYTLNNKFLPYNNQLIFLTDFFNKVENPSEKQLKTLKRWFWITTYANYFTIYNLSKQRLAYKEFQSFIQNEHHNPIYYDRKDERFETLEFPTKIEMGSVRAKALGLFMLYHQAEGKQLDVHLVDGYKEYRLFLECKNPKASENTILVIDDGKYPIDKFQKDLSHWLEETENYEPFFITSAMQNAYKNGENKEYILAMRKKLMIAAEKEFVESFKLIYIEE